jgi:hypothetical protein
MDNVVAVNGGVLCGINTNYGGMVEILHPGDSWECANRGYSRRYLQNHEQLSKRWRHMRPVQRRGERKWIFVEDWRGP